MLQLLFNPPLLEYNLISKEELFAESYDTGLTGTIRLLNKLCAYSNTRDKANKLAN